MKTLAEIVEKTIAKDKMGRIVEGDSTYIPIGTIRITTITPFSSYNTLKTYGYEISTTHRAFSYEEIEPPIYLRVGSDIYFVKEVSDFPKVNALLLEKV